ncbi:MAG: hypothetical protein AB9836_04655 [Aminipila sp.]
MKKKFKIGVSNWKCTFEDGSTESLEMIQREVVDLYCDGTSRIMLQLANQDEEVLKKFKEGVVLKRLVREECFYKANNKGIAEMSKELEATIYPNMKIKSFKQISKKDEAGSYLIILKGGADIKNGTARV